MDSLTALLLVILILVIVISIPLTIFFWAKGVYTSQLLKNAETENEKLRNYVNWAQYNNQRLLEDKK